MRYNYVIFGTDSSLARFTFSDLRGRPDVILAPTVKENLGLLYPLYRAHFSNRINSIVRLPWKSIWNPCYFKNLFHDDKPICFVFMRYLTFVNEEIQLTAFFKRHFPGCKCVIYIRDLFHLQLNAYSKRPFEIERINKDYDLAISFDKGDCDRYGLHHFPLVFSSYNEPLVDMPKSDIYFLGWAKNRYKEIIESYERLRDEGLSIDFNLAGVKPSEQLYSDQIKYIDNMTYTDNLQHVAHTKCILEIMQKGGVGYTQRGAEAICLGKKLLTNNMTIDKEPFYNPRYISQFSSPSDMDSSFLQSIKDDSVIDYHFKEKISPLALLEFIEKSL